MNLQAIRDRIPDPARDIKLNLETLLGPEGLPGLSTSQVASVAVACAYSTGATELAQAIAAESALSHEPIDAAKGAAAIMAMNNVYYRTMHLLDDKAVSQLPARLRMNIIGKPGISKLDFELMSFAISAIAGCGVCLNSHSAELKKNGVAVEGLHSAIKIASVIQAASSALKFSA